MQIKFIIILALILNLSCQSNNKTAKTDLIKDLKPDFSPGPHAIVYKTKFDYNNKVPVILSEDKTEIVSYPHPNDIKLESGFPLPTELIDNYLLDNRGINENVAFLQLSYEEYSRFDTLLPLATLSDLIIDKNPLIEICDCGNKKAFSDLTAQLNMIIEQKSLRKYCKIIK